MQREFEPIVGRLREAILETSADAILATDRQGVIRFWNPGAVRIFGFAKEEAVGQSLDLIIPQQFRQRHWEGWERVLTTGETRYGAGDLLAVPAITRDGRQISVEFTIILLQGPDQRIAGVGAILRDVTVRFEETRRLKRQVAEKAQQKNPI